jgi:hypothetical protein
VERTAMVMGENLGRAGRAVMGANHGSTKTDIRGNRDRTAKGRLNTTATATSLGRTMMTKANQDQKASRRMERVEIEAVRGRTTGTERNKSRTTDGKEVIGVSPGSMNRKVKENQNRAPRVRTAAKETIMSLGRVVMNIGGSQSKKTKENLIRVRAAAMEGAVEVVMEAGVVIGITTRKTKLRNTATGTATGQDARTGHGTACTKGKTRRCTRTAARSRNRGKDDGYRGT